MTAPTEAEIREALRARVERFPSDNPADTLEEAIEGYASFMTGPAYVVLESPDDRGELLATDEPGDIWRSDLRPSEAVRLRELAQQAQERALQRAQEAIVEELVAAALRFAAEYPEAPRAKALQPA